MTLPPLPLLDGALFVSSSFLDTLPCPRASQYYKLNARTRKEEGAGLLFGKHLHDTLSLFYHLQEYNLPQSTIREHCVGLLEQLFTEHPQEDPDDWRNLNWAIEVIDRYSAKYGFPDYEVMRYPEAQDCSFCCGQGEVENPTYPDNPVKSTTTCIWCNSTGKTSIMSEISFVVKLADVDLNQFMYFRSDMQNYYWKGSKQGAGNELYEWRIRGNTTIPIYFHGFIDLLVRRNFLIFPLDFKTTSQMGPGYWDGQRASGQQKGYSWALEQLLGIKSHGYIIHGIRTNPPPKYVIEGLENRKGERKQVSDWWNESLVDQRFDFGDGEIEEWRVNTIHQVEQFLWHYSNSFFPQNKSQCVGKFGRCQYYDVCHTFPPDQRHLILNSDLFKDKEQVQNLIK